MQLYELIWKILLLTLINFTPTIEKKICLKFMFSFDVNGYGKYNEFEINYDKGRNLIKV